MQTRDQKGSFYGVRMWRLNEPGTDCLQLLLGISLDTGECIYFLIPYSHRELLTSPHAEEQVKAPFISSGNFTLLGVLLRLLFSLLTSTTESCPSLSHPESTSEQGNKHKNPPSQGPIILLWTEPNFHFSFPTNGEIIYTCCLFFPLIQSPNHCSHLLGSTTFH